jgi:hypothetical protein
MTQERPGERARSTHATHPTSESRRSVGEILGAAVGQLAPLDVAPQGLGGIQVGGVARQPFDPQPVALRAEPIADQDTLVRRQLVPDEDDAPSPDIAGERFEDREHAVPVAVARRGAEPQLMATAVPAKAQRGAHHELLPVEMVDQEWSLAPRGPGPADRRPLRDPTLVVEENPGLPASGVFFTADQRWVTQPRIAAASRSRACVAGRWSVQPSARRTRQT